MKTIIMKIFIFLIFASIAAYVVNHELGKENTVTELPSGFTHYEREKEFSALLIVDDILYAGGFEGVYRFNIKTGEALGGLTAPAPLTVVKALFHEKEDLIWVGYQDGIAVFENGQFIKYIDKNDGIPQGRVNTILRDKKGRIWTGTFQGAYYGEDDQWIGFTEKEGLINDMVNVMFEDSRGFLWFGSNIAGAGGLTCLGDDKIWTIGVPEGLCHVAVTSITEDKYNHIWVGAGVLFTGGANRIVLNNNQWEVIELLNDENGLPGEKVRYVHMDLDQNMWFCTEFDGAMIFKDGEARALLTEKDGLSDNEIKYILQDMDKNYYLATSKGITIIAYETLNSLIK